MSHTIRDKQKLLNRVRRIEGQLKAVKTGLDKEADSITILHNIAACRGAIDSLMGEIIEGHVRFHVMDPDKDATSEQSKAAQELIDIVKTYLK